MGTEGHGTVSARFLRLALRYAERHGVDPARSLRAVRLEEVSDDERIDGGRFAALLARLADLARDPLFGIRLGAWAASQPIHHLVLATALSAASAGEALRRLVRFHGLLADALAPVMVENEGTVELRVHAAPGVGGYGQLAEAAVAMLSVLVRRIGGGAVAVSLRRAPATPRGECRRLLGADVRFGARFDAVHFPAHLLATSNPLADPELGELLERHAAGRLAEVQRVTWTTRAGRAVRGGLVEMGSTPTLGQVSRALGTTPRTLQLRLAEEGSGFRTVCDAVRRQRGEELLRDRAVSLVEVAFLLGFADQSAFTNAFRRWTGQTPAAYRRSISPVRR